MKRSPVLSMPVICVCCAISIGGWSPTSIAWAQDNTAANDATDVAKQDGPEDNDKVPAKDDVTASDEAEAVKKTEESSGAKQPESVKLDGILQAVHADTIRIDVEEWSSLTVVDAVEHGAKVQAGDVLIKLETDKLERAIEDEKHDFHNDELSLADAEIKLELARRSQDLALKAAAAADRTATEDLKDFVAVGRDRRVESLERSVTSARNRLEYQAEELKQLEQMYEADDLTEETEEIILKRTRDAVDSTKYSLGLVLNSQRQGLEFDLPRQEEQLEQAVARASLALEEARRTAPQSLTRQEMQVEKLREELERKREKLERLRQDLKHLHVTAPRSGIVYYGAPRRGKWSDPSSLESMLQPGGTPKARAGTDDDCGTATDGRTRDGPGSIHPPRPARYPSHD